MIRPYVCRVVVVLLIFISAPAFAQTPNSSPAPVYFRALGSAFTLSKFLDVERCLYRLDLKSTSPAAGSTYKDSALRQFFQSDLSQTILTGVIASQYLKFEVPKSSLFISELENCGLLTSAAAATFLSKAEYDYSLFLVLDLERTNSGGAATAVQLQTYSPPASRTPVTTAAQIAPPDSTTQCALTLYSMCY